MRAKPAPGARDQYKGVKEGGVMAILQKPGEAPFQVDLKKGYSGGSDQKSDQNGNPPNDPTR
jgi:hypothetical protein